MYSLNKNIKRSQNDKVVVNSIFALLVLVLFVTPSSYATTQQTTHGDLDGLIGFPSVSIGNQWWGASAAGVGAWAKVGGSVGGTITKTHMSGSVFLDYPISAGTGKLRYTGNSGYVEMNCGFEMWAQYKIYVWGLEYIGDLPLIPNIDYRLYDYQNITPYLLGGSYATLADDIYQRTIIDAPVVGVPGIGSAGATVKLSTSLSNKVYGLSLEQNAGTINTPSGYLSPNLSGTSYTNSNIKHNFKSVPSLNITPAGGLYVTVLGLRKDFAINILAVPIPLPTLYGNSSPLQSVTFGLPNIGTSPSSISFPDTLVGGSSSKTLTITNNGQYTLNISNVSESSIHFSLSSTGPFSILPGSSKNITVYFASQSSGNQSTDVTITSDDPDTPTKAIFISGYGIPPYFDLNVKSSGASGVSISSTTGHGGTTNYTKTILNGTSVNLQSPQYIGSCASRLRFTGWAGSVSSSALSITFTMDGSKTVTANYVSDPETYTLTVNSSGASGVSITSATGHSGTTNYTKTVNCGTNVTLTAPQYFGSCASRLRFTGWTGSISNSSQSITFAMDGLKTVTANYTSDPEPIVLTVNSSGASGVSITSTTGHGGTTNYTKNGTCGTSVNLQSPQYIGSCASRLRFTGWAGSVSSSALSITFTMDGSKTVTANYIADPETYTLTVNSSGASGISITSATGHSGTTNYTKTVNCGTNVTLTAPQYFGLGASRLRFTGWTGSVSDSNQSITFAMDSLKTVTANYIADPVVYTVNLSKVGNGCIKVNGTPYSMPCSKSVIADTNVMLEAVANSGWQFSHWSGGLSGYTNPWTIQMNDANYSKAHFTSLKPPCKIGNFGGQKNVKLILKDCSNNDVTFMLTGGGYGEIDCQDCNFSNISLYNTTDKSILTIKTKAGQETNVGDIVVNGSIKAISAKVAILLGDITATGAVGTLTFNSVENSTILIGPSSSPKAAVTMAFGEVINLNIDSKIPIKSITATDWIGGSINAPSVGSITANGDKKRGIIGDLDIDVDNVGDIGTVKVAGTLFGEWNCMSAKSITASDTEKFFLTVRQLPDAKRMALGTLSVKNTFGLSQITASGNIGTVTAGRFYDSTCFAGIASASISDLNSDEVFDLPAADAATFNLPATIKSIKINGIKGEPYAMTNSNIAAANISSASLVYPAYNNNGTPFGIAADSIKSLKIKDSSGTRSWKNIGTPGDIALGGDCKIKLK